MAAGVNEKVQITGVETGDAVEGFTVDIVAAGVDPAVVAQHTVLTSAAGDPVVAVAADDVVVLALTEENVPSSLAVDEVVPGFAVDLVASADIKGCLICCGQIVGPAWCVVDQFRSPRDDPQCIVVVVIEGQERTVAGPVGSHKAEDVAVVAQDHVGVPCVAG